MIFTNLVYQDVAKTSLIGTFNGQTISVQDGHRFWIFIHDPTNSLTVADFVAPVPTAEDIAETDRLAVLANIHNTAFRTDVSRVADKGHLGGSFDLGNVTGTVQLQISDGNIQHGLLVADATLIAPNDAAQGYIELELTVNSTGGFALTLSGFVEITGTFDNTANKVNVLRISKLDTNTYLEIVQAI